MLPPQQLVKTKTARYKALITTLCQPVATRTPRAQAPVNLHDNTAATPPARFAPAPGTLVEELLLPLPRQSPSPSVDELPATGDRVIPPKLRSFARLGVGDMVSKPAEESPIELAPPPIEVPEREESIAVGNAVIW